MAEVVPVNTSKDKKQLMSKDKKQLIVKKKKRKRHAEPFVFNNYTINPKSSVYRYWWGWTIVLTLMFVFIMPARLAFVADNEGSVISALENFIDINFFLDIVLNFRLCFFRYGVLVKDPSIVAKRYVAFRFWVDLIGCFPAAALFGSFVDTHGLFALELLGLLRFVRVARLAHFIRQLEQNFKYNYNMLALCKFLFIILFAGHISGCGLYLIARMNGFERGTWVGEFVDDLPNQSFAEQYVTSMYWGMTTLTTVGYGDLSPVSVAERVFTMCVMIINLSISAYILGNMTLLATRQDAETAAQRTKLHNLHTFMQMRQIPANVCKTALAHLQLTAEMSKDDDTVLEHCPTFIRIKLLRFLYRDFFMKQYMFAETSDQFLSQLVASLNVENYFPGDYIYNAGDEPNAFYCIVSGSAEVLSGTTSDRSSLLSGGSRSRQSADSFTDASERIGRTEKVERKLGAGMMFGEAAVLCDFPQPWSVRVKTLLRALQVKRPMWVSLAAKFPRDVGGCQKRMLKVIDDDLAATQNKVDVVLEEVHRLVKAGIAKNQEDMVTELCFAASRGDTMDVRRLIKGAGLRPNDADYDGRAALHLACVGGHEETVQFLLDHKADPSIVDNFGTTPLQESVKRGHNSVSDMLLKAGGQLNLAEAGSKLCALAFEGFTKELNDYLKYGINPDEADYDQRCALHLAAAEGVVSCVKILIEYKADVNFADRWGQTPLDEAVASKQRHVIEFLQQNGGKRGKQRE